MTRAAWFALAALVIPGIASAQDAAPTGRPMSTDRPDKTESPYTVDAGRFQIEMDFATVTWDRTATERTRAVDIAPVNVKFGLSDDTDLQVIVRPYAVQRVTDRATGTVQRTHGFGDTTIRLKHNIWGNDDGPTAFALMPFVTLPTNSDNMGGEAIEGGVIAPLAIALGGDFDLGVMTEVDLRRRSEGTGYAATFVNSATLSHGLSDSWGLYVELFTEQGAERRARFIATIDTGLTYALSPDNQFDLGVNLGVTDAADDLNLFVGFSRRF